MIFYFTGTGNSEAAAKALPQEDEVLISMTKAKWEEKFTYAPAEGEAVGFVFPVYFYGMPATVRDFLSCVNFTKAPDYVYTVITCGGSIAGAGGLVQKILAKNNVHLNAVYSLKMPDNYIVMFTAPTVEEETPILAAADVELEKIRRSIAARAGEGIPVKALAKMETSLLYPFYDRLRNTKKFYTIDTCIGCGSCAAGCPAKAIEMVDGKPVWVKNKCDHCMSCLRCNAVQYGKGTLEKARYKHPSLRKSCH